MRANRERVADNLELLKIDKPEVYNAREPEEALTWRR